MSERDDRPARGPALRDPGAALPPELDPRGPGRPPPGPRPVRRWKRRLAWTALALSVVMLAVAGVGYASTAVRRQHRPHPGLIRRCPAAKRRPPPRTPATSCWSAPTAGRAPATSSRARARLHRRPARRHDHPGPPLRRQRRRAARQLPARQLRHDPDLHRPQDQQDHRRAQGQDQLGHLRGRSRAAVDTLENLTKIKVDNYIVIDFAGFQAMVNRLGGVEVCLTTRPRRRTPSRPAGRPADHLRRPGARLRPPAQGAAARRRRPHRPPAALHRVADPQGAHRGTLLNPCKLNGFLSAPTKTVTADDALRLGAHAGAAAQGHQRGRRQLHDPAVHRPGRPARRAGRRPARPRQGRGAVRRAAPDRAPGQAAPGTPAAARRAAVRAAARHAREGLNGGGTAGRGRAVADDLAARGLRHRHPGQRGHRRQRHRGALRPDQADSARTLAASVPGATLQADPGLGSTVQLVVGSSYTGTVAVSVSPVDRRAPRRPPGPRRRPPPPPRTAVSPDPRPGLPGARDPPSRC